MLLPTYNRAGSLSRTIESVLAQTQPDFELLDLRQRIERRHRAMCRQYVSATLAYAISVSRATSDPIGNFNWLLAQARTEFVLMLADDDWLDADYLACCLAIIERDPALSIVTGATRYFEGDGSPRPGAQHQSDPRPRADGACCAIFATAGPAPRSMACCATAWSRTRCRSPNVMGADWLFVSALSFSGRVLTTTDTHLNRTRGGTSADFQRIAEVSMLSSRAARNPHLAIAFNQFRDIAFSSASYVRLGRTRRFVLGLAGAGAIVAGHPLDVVWDALGPFIVDPRIERFTQPLLDRLRAHRSV